MGVHVRAHEVDKDVAMGGFVRVVRERAELFFEPRHIDGRCVGVGEVGELVDPVVGRDGIVAFEECERERGVDGGQLGIGGGGESIAARGLGTGRRTLGDGGGELRFEEREELVRRRDVEGDVVGVDVLGVVGELLALLEDTALDAPSGEREKEDLGEPHRVRDVVVFVAGHVGVLVERELARHHGRRGTSRDVENVAVVVVTGPRPLVRVLADADVYRFLDVVLVFEEVPCTEERPGGDGTVDLYIHVCS